MKVVSLKTINSEPNLIMTVPDGDMAGKELLAEFSVCKDAACTCTEATIELVDLEAPDQAAAAFLVDVERSALAENDSPYSNPSFDSSLGIPLVTSLADNFDSEDWDTLRGAFYAQKLELTKKLDFDQTSAKFPRTSQIEKFGEMASYAEILPFGEKFHLSKAGDCNDFIGIDDQYCVLADCDCTLAMISMYSFKNGLEDSKFLKAVEVDVNTCRIKRVIEDVGGQDSATELWGNFSRPFRRFAKSFLAGKKI
jgi:hypothetical protein